MDDYADFLLGEVLGERKIITYRHLSRSLKVHVDVAKEMLYDFHASQNKTNPGSVHATYLLTGLRRLPDPPKDEDDDTAMESSPFDTTQTTANDESWMVRTFAVVPQEKLEASKASFSHLSSIHVYSLQPSKLTDLHIISGACQELLAQGMSEETEMEPVYGTISNSFAKKRNRPTVFLQTASPAPTSLRKPATPTVTEKPERKQTTNTLTSAFAKKPESKAKKPEPKVKKGEPKEPAGEPKAKVEPPTKKAVQTTAGKKTQKDFFSSWNTGSQKAKDKKSTASQTTPSQDKEPISTKMDTDSEGDDPDSPPIPAQDLAEESRKRKARQQELEAMMDLSDEDEKPPPKKKTATPPPPPVKSTTPSPPPVKPATPPLPVKSESPEPPPLPAGRRRGKRKVTKKITSKDDEGYLVTTLETMWESYSEDEPEPLPKPAARPAPMKKAVKGKGQGNIMNFFQKK